jgi:heat shock protein HtpX
MTPAFGLYTHIQSNRRRSLFLLGTLFSLIYVLAFAGALGAAAIAYDWSLQALLEQALQDTIAHAPYITAGALAWIWFAWVFNQKIIALAVPTHSLERSDAPALYDMVETLCISRGMSVPRLAVLESAAPNAFASGVNDKQYTITFTRGLLDLLDPAELEAVAAHELTHIRNEDVRMMVVAMIIAGVVSFFCELLFRVVGRRGGFRSSRRSSNSEGKGKGGGAAAIAIALLIVAAAWALSLMIRLALSRSREYLADAGAVELTKNPDAMISALRKIDGNGEIDEAPSGVMEMCIDNPRSGFADLFSTHPSMEDRIKALTLFAGGTEELA